MMTVAEVIDWLQTLPPDSSVGVDDGGLCLREVSAKNSMTNAYCEIGGIPEDVEFRES